MNHFKIYSGRVPDYVAVSRQTLKNQIELPIIFYFLISIILYFEQVFFIDLFLAWLFVLSRYVHAYVRLSSNRIKHRSITFQIGFYTLLFWFLKFIYNIMQNNSQNFESGILKLKFPKTNIYLESLFYRAFFYFLYLLIGKIN